MSQISVDQIVDVNGGNAVQINGMTPTAESMQGFRNRIINGDMRIDQRANQSALSIVNTTPAFAVDRWAFVGASQAGQLTVTRSTVTPNSSFTNSYLVTVTSTDSGVSASSNTYRLQQAIEGFNTADLGWGTAGAQAVTISFWVRSSLTGTFGGAVRNSANNRSYPFTFTVTSANNWEQKTITIAGDTSGTWLTDNGIGILLNFSLGAGSSQSSTAGVWAAGNFSGATGQTQVIATNGATFYLTGVQLEAGSVATPFERRPYGTELALCQRYYVKYLSPSAEFWLASGQVTAGDRMRVSFNVPVPLRATPSISFSGTAINDWSVQVAMTGTSVINTTVNTVSFNALCAGGLSAPRIGLIAVGAAGNFIDFASEL